MILPVVRKARACVHSTLDNPRTCLPQKTLQHYLTTTITFTCTLCFQGPSPFPFRFPFSFPFTFLFTFLSTSYYLNGLELGNITLPSGAQRLLVDSTAVTTYAGALLQFQCISAAYLSSGIPSFPTQSATMTSFILSFLVSLFSLFSPSVAAQSYEFIDIVTAAAYTAPSVTTNGSVSAVATACSTSAPLA